MMSKKNTFLYLNTLQPPIHYILLPIAIGSSHIKVQLAGTKISGCQRSL